MNVTATVVQLLALQIHRSLLLQVQISKDKLSFHVSKTRPSSRHNVYLSIYAAYCYEKLNWQLSLIENQFNLISAGRRWSGIGE